MSGSRIVECLNRRLRHRRLHQMRAPAERGGGRHRAATSGARAVPPRSRGAKATKAARLVGSSARQGKPDVRELAEELGSLAYALRRVGSHGCCVGARLLVVHLPRVTGCRAGGTLAIVAKGNQLHIGANRAFDLGGGICNDRAPMDISSTTIADNRAGLMGGGIASPRCRRRSEGGDGGSGVEAPPFARNYLGRCLKIPPTPRPRTPTYGGIRLHIREDPVLS